MSAVLEAREPSARYLEAVQTALVRQFELLATAPSGMARLREFVYVLAAGGNLARTTESDCAVKLGEVAEFIMGQAPPGAECNKVGAGTVFVKTGEFGVLYPAVCEWTTKPLKFAQSGDVLICVVGATIGKLNLAIDCAIGRSVAAIRPSKVLQTKYLYYALMPFTLALRNGARGSAQGVIGKTDLASIGLRVPSLNEQDVIVARVEELIRLCDALEAKGRLEAAQHAHLLGTLLGTLTDSSTPEELAANWQRVAGHFDLLLDRPEAVDALEQTILQLAVRGLLVPQDAIDEPVIALMQRVRLARETSDLSGRAKRGGFSKPHATLAEPFTLPVGWMWSTLPDLCGITGGSTPSKAVASNWIGDIPWVSPKDMKVPVIEEAQDHVSSAAIAGSLSLIAPGSLLMVVRGMILAHSFPVAVTQVPVTINQDMKALTPLEPRLLPFLMLLCEGMKTEVLALVDRSTHGTCKLESPKIFGLQMPLPPLAEQVRIVARVTELRRLCAVLRQRLAASQTTQSHLAEALVESAAA